MSGSQRVLVIEDEPAIADTLLYALRTEGFAPVHCATAHDGLEEIRREAAVLVILDVGLPDQNGFELCKQIRAQSSVPILFLTARNAEIDRVVGLEIGGDDYVTKPFSPREVTARVKAILRRGPGAAAVASEVVTRHVLTTASGVVTVEIDGDRCEVRVGGGRVELTRYEFRLLQVLAARPGRVFSRDELMAQVWDDPGASLDRTVDAHIKTVRAKLRVAAPAIDPIQTHRGIGYAWRSA
jgi:two-component system, OmpR family, catabolic regulation response regulator CreB